MNKPELIKFVLLFLLLLFTFSSENLSGQGVKYDPKGNPEKWTFEITPFLVLPWVNGDVQSEMLSKDFGIDPTGYITSLNGTFMMGLSMSKQRFFFAPSYIYNYNQLEKVLWTDKDSNQSIIAEPKLQKHILEVIGGMRVRLGKKFILDPYVGFRYTHYRVFGAIERITDITEFDEYVDFWDPVFGLHAHYYPHPRVPVELKADIGGFGIGSQLTWSLWFNTGYAVSPTVDLIAGFAALSNNYKTQTPKGKPYGMTSITYGFDLGVRFYILPRAKDPAVFKKFKK